MTVVVPFRRGMEIDGDVANGSLILLKQGAEAVSSKKFQSFL